MGRGPARLGDDKNNKLLEHRFRLSWGEEIEPARLGEDNEGPKSVLERRSEKYSRLLSLLCLFMSIKISLCNGILK